ncbi:MAG: hypothetical protein AB1705_22205 [Verrucomicrobiota bacterium]
MSICWELESRLHGSSDVTETDITLHRETFHRALSCGEDLILEWADQNANVRVLGVDRLTMESTLQSLRVKYTKWHGVWIPQASQQAIA